MKRKSFLKFQDKKLKKAKRLEEFKRKLKKMKHLRKSGCLRKLCMHWPCLYGHNGWSLRHGLASAPSSGRRGNMIHVGRTSRSSFTTQQQT